MRSCYHGNTRADGDESRQLFIGVAGPRLGSAQAVPGVLDPLLAEWAAWREPPAMAGQLVGDAMWTRSGSDLRASVPTQLSKTACKTPPCPPRWTRTCTRCAWPPSALRLSLAAADRQAPLAAVLFKTLGTLPGGLLQALLPPDHEEGLSDALGALLDHHLVHLAGDERRIVMAAPVRAWAWRHWQAEAARSAHGLIEEIHQRLAAYASHLDDGLGTPRAQTARLQFLAESSNLLQLVDVRLHDPWPIRDDPVAASVLRSLCLFSAHRGTWHVACCRRWHLWRLRCMLVQRVATAPQSSCSIWAT